MEPTSLITPNVVFHFTENSYCDAPNEAVPIVLNANNIVSFSPCMPEEEIAEALNNQAGITRIRSLVDGGIENTTVMESSEEVYKKIKEAYFDAASKLVKLSPSNKLSQLFNAYVKLPYIEDDLQYAYEGRDMYLLSDHIITIYQKCASGEIEELTQEQGAVSRLRWQIGRSECWAESTLTPEKIVEIISEAEFEHAKSLRDFTLKIR